MSLNCGLLDLSAVGHGAAVPHVPASPKNTNHLPANIAKIHHISNLSEFDFIIDIRPYNYYSQAHIKNSINICIPTTLLKRASLDLFSILKLVNIPQHYKDLLLLKISNPSPPPNEKLNVLFYDSNSSTNHISLNLYQTIIKFNQFPEVFALNYLEGGFQLHLHQPPSPKKSSIHSGDSTSTLDDSAASSPVTTNSTFSTTLDSNDDLIEYTDNPLDSVEDVRDSKCFLSGFKLPSSTNYRTKFINSIKKNSLFDEKSKQVDVKSYHYNFKYPKGYSSKNISEFPYLPKWMNFLTNSNENVLANLIHKFNKIEALEKLRLSSLVTNCSTSEEVDSKMHLHIHSPSTNAGSTSNSSVCTPNGLCPDCDEISYKMPKGIEYGFKNRYNNIWPYEHSRVRLDTPSEDDYFNANYIRSLQVVPTHYSYIATQNPLKDTVKDFWKTIDSEKIKIIISLDNSPLLYLKDSANVLSLEIVHSNSSTVVRKINNDIYHFEFKKWPDFGVPQDFDSILSLIQFKNELYTSKINPEHSKILVHCSAGCGRTGVFITIDSLIDHFKLDSTKLLGTKEDLIYKLVQNQRRQRLSMVQNLDQYIVGYEIFLYYLSNLDKFNNELGPNYWIKSVNSDSQEPVREKIRTADVNTDFLGNDDYFLEFSKPNYTNIVRSN